MIIKTIPAGIYDANCYILVSEDTNEAVVIDPGGDHEILIEAITKMNAKVKMVLLTHGHADHTGAVSQLRSRYNVPVYINQKDAEYIANNTFIFGKPEENGDKYISDSDVLNMGNIEIKCLETPGHTPGGMCFLVENSIFTGDTLFFQSIGRTDFVGGDYGTLIKSIKEKIMVLPDNYLIYPGHGPKSTIEYEKNNNPFFQ